MDFGLVGKLVRSNSATAGSNNGGSLASETDLRLYGSAFLNKDSTAVEDELPPAKAARISPCGGDMAKVSLQECNNGGVSTQQMLCFSPRNASFAAFPFLRSSPGPFTPSQWMELEHQALIYKYITANVPIPSHLLMPIRKALHAASGILSCFSLQTPNPLGWLGFSKADPEPGRCRRTDGKKWRCSRDAVADHKYCERHMNRGRHRSRKPVEPQPKPAKTTIDRSSSSSYILVCSCNGTDTLILTLFVSSRCLIAAYSDSLLNPTAIAPVSSRNRGGDREDERKSEHSLRHFIDEWPQNQPSSSRESNSWVPISWEASVGGPLGEALHRTSECKSSKVENSSTLGAFIAPGLMPAL